MDSRLNVEHFMKQVISPNYFSFGKTESGESIKIQETLLYVEQSNLAWLNQVCLVCSQSSWDSDSSYCDTGNNLFVNSVPIFFHQSA